MTTAQPPDGDPRATYRRKLRPLRDAVDLLRPDDVVAAPIAGGQPVALLTALAERDDWRDLRLFSGLLIAPYPVLQHPGVRVISGFYGPIERMLQSMHGRIDYLPADFIGWERYATAARPRVVASALGPMDAEGYLSFGVHAGATFHAFLDAARDPERLAIGEVVPDMPRVLGVEISGGNRVHVSEVDCLVETDRPLFELPTVTAAPADAVIAAHVERLIEDGATLQIGIGGIPNTVAQLLADGPKGDLGIHTEMMVDGIMRLHRAGKVTNQKGVHDGYSVCTFAAGSRALYQWMDGNPEVRMLPVLETNDPAVIRRNRKMVSINGALAIDLAGQVTADTIGARQYSGVGGHELFVTGAHDSPGGKSIICLRSTVVVGGATVSTIVAALPRGARVSTPRHHVQIVVTEHGVADLSMLTHRERADALIGIAHPDFRETLRREVTELEDGQ
jgi:acyl-CoA hydrolase